MEFFQRNLQVRLMVCFVLFVIWPMGVVGFMGYRSGRNSMVDHVKSHLASIAGLKEQEIKNWTEHLAHSLTWMAESPENIRNAAILATHAVDAARYRAAHESLNAEFNRIEALGHVSPVFLMDPSDGRIIASSDAAWEDKFRNNEPYFLQGKNEVFVSEIFFSLPLGRSTMVISAPVKDNKGHLVGIMAAHVDLKRLSEIMRERSGMHKTMETFLVNPSNLLITNTVFEPDGAFKKWIFGQGAKWALEGKTGVGQFLDYREEKVIGAYRWLPHSKLALIAKQDESEAFKFVNTLRNQIFFISFATIAAAFILAFLISRSITEPIGKLTRGTEIVGKGDLTHRVAVKRMDEIGKLAAAFNQMTEKRQRAEKELAQSSVYLNAMGDALLVLNPQKEVIKYNRATAEILGYAQEDMQELTFEKIFPEKEHEKHSSEMNLALETGKPRMLETWILRKDGKEIPVLLTGAAMTDSRGELAGFVGVCRDITQQKEMDEELKNHRENLEEIVKNRTVELQVEIAERNRVQEEIRRLNENLEQRIEERSAELNQRISEVEQLNSAMVNILEDLRASKENLEITAQELSETNRELDSFSYSVSHDLRAPLRAIAGFSQMLVEDYGSQLDEGGQHQLDVIQSSARQMGQLIDDLLTFSRLGRKGLKISEINMHALADEVVKQFQILEAEKTARVNIDSLPSAQGDRNMIREVLMNLLSNALKYSSTREAASIEVSAKAEGNEHVYSVKDNGVGFDMKHSDKLFDVFQRLHSSEEFEGTGIGLALVQRIIHRHGGRVWGEGKVNEGATFYFSLPKSEA